MLNKRSKNFKIIGISLTIMLILILIIGYRLGYKKDIEKINTHAVGTNP